MKSISKPVRLVAVLLTAAVLCAALSLGAVALDTRTGGGTYRISFLLPDGSLIRSRLVPAGETPVYDGPVSAQDDYFDYTITGWSPDLAPATADASYTALYTRTLRTDEGAKSRLRGDANGDGRVNILDATTVQRYLAGLYDDPHGVINVLGVTSDKDYVTILDATRIQRYLAGFSNIHYIDWIIGTEPETPPVEPTEPTEPPVQPTDPPIVDPSATDTYELPPV